MPVNPNSLPKIDPMRLTNEFTFFYQDAMYRINGVKKDEHEAPYAVEIGNEDVSIEFLMNNGILMKPVYEGYAEHDKGRKRWQGVIGMKPVRLEWTVDPHLVESLLGPDKKGELIGVKRYSRKKDDIASAKVGRYSGSYRYGMYGGVLPSVDQKFEVSIFTRNEKYVNQPDSFDTHPYSFAITNIEALLPNTKATMTFLKSLRPSRKDATADHKLFEKEMKELEEALKPSEVKTQS